MRVLRTLPPHLEKWRARIEEWAREYGLDPFETYFEMLDYRQMNEIAAYGGFPNRYPYWRFGMEYDRLSKGYTFGLSKIYEMVINNDPCYAYLMEANSDLENKMVMAHVYGHADFFQNNLWFANTNRKMVDEAANHGTRVRRYVDKYGLARVEEFLDVCHSLENLVDYYSPFVTRQREEEEESVPDRDVPKISTPRPYMSSFLNPPEFLEEQRERMEKLRERQRRFPEYAEKDVLLFMLENAPLESWQRDILDIVREEAYYFAPQRQTKIMNEGWATYWHSRLMTEKILSAAEVVDYADIHSGTLGTSPGVLNPYKVGVELFRDIEDRWNKGRFGREWEECEDLVAKREWDRGLGQGQEKIFEVRKLYNDITFIDTFLTNDFVEKHLLFTYEFNYRSGQYEIASRAAEAIREKLLFQLTNLGEPFIYVLDGNFRNRGELLLHHKFEGIELRFDWAVDTLRNLNVVWQRPVHIQTVVDGKLKILSHDGSDLSEEVLESPFHEDALP
jgi:stage V sporulation protein R